jgi:hypothetical protein
MYVCMYDCVHIIIVTGTSQEAGRTTRVGLIVVDKRDGALAIQTATTGLEDSSCAIRSADAREAFVIVTCGCKCASAGVRE